MIVVIVKPYRKTSANTVIIIGIVYGYREELDDVA
jgi:hypothetical protein